MSEPTIPLKHAEVIHVALATMVHVLSTRTDYPVDNMETVLAGYRKSRNEHLSGRGYTYRQINMYTEAATEALVSWLEDRSARKARIDSDFAEWAREILDEDWMT